ncbi:hypothetical protein GWI33_006236 [Rhynchophorus ferrugineus]|uniref:endo-polygalacturonase n=1 Tax=Rhynchophorus ferrugineus TaxID=354439 RepID=A0A834IJH2_RHYFE|nr:hypothetical protein GWI33_006236 [Rhynchophorus ferrugineus]
MSIVLLLILCLGHALASDSCVVTEYDDVETATASCQDLIINNLQVPAGVTLELSLRDGATLTFVGNTTFGFENWSGPLMKVAGDDITIRGEPGHVLNGLGELYWDGLGSWGTLKPRFMWIEVSNAVFRDIHIYHAPMHAIHLTNSTNVVFTDFLIDNADGAIGVAPYNHEGHNTDGFGVELSHNITIKNSKIYNQDDCVALNSGSNILVSNLLCHGSHGLSLSVGFSNDSFETNTLTDVVIEDSIIIDAMDGIHIKTHIDAGEGIIRNVTYRNIFMIGSYEKGIAIEQNYTNTLSPGNGAEPRNNIPIQDLVFDNIRGTVLNTSVPYYIVCAKDGCLNWKWSDINVYGLLDSACVNYHPDVIDCVDYDR